MAERRMFSKKITDSDAFIEMSSSTQALYFHLTQGADDDGFNNQIQQAMYKAHASIDDLKVLMTKRFVIRFESGVCVIKHWWIHNTLRKDRYKPTNFQEEIQQLGLKENLSYTLDKEQSVRLPFGCHLVAPKEFKLSSSTIKSREYEIKEKESYLNNNSQYEESKFVNNKGDLLKGENTEVEQTDDNEPLSAETLKDDLDTFCSRFGIMIDNYNYRISQMDFKALTERFEESEWLKANVTSFKKICDIYPRIISGYYKDYNRKPKGSREFDILQRMLKEAEEEEEREKQEKGESDNGPQESS